MDAPALSAFGAVPLQLATVATALSLLIIPIVWRFAPRWGLLDLPGERKVHGAPVPRVGGWGITFGALIPLYIWGELDTALYSYLLACLILFVFGIWDDLRELGHWVKFAGQIAAGCTVVYGGGLYVTRIPFLDADGFAPSVGQPFTVVALVGVINAINHADGLDGLAAGETLLSLLGILILGSGVTSTPLVGVTLAVVGGIVGFLRYNSHPARVFMGDSGSQVLGLTLGVLAIYLTQRADTALSAVTPLLVVGVPIIDILSVLVQRIRGGANWFKASRNHLHHRLLDLGISHFQAVIVLYSIQATFVLAAILLRYNTDWNLTLTYLLLVASLLLGLRRLELRGWHALHVSSARESRHRDSGIREGRQIAVAMAVIMVGTPGFMLFASAWSEHVPRDLGITASALAALLLLHMMLRLPARALVLRVTGYVAAIMSAYLLVGYPKPGTAGAIVDWAVIGLMFSLVMAITVFAHFAARDRFGTTPTDYLLLLVLVALLALAAIDIQARAAVEMFFLTVILLYGCEILITRDRRRTLAFASMTFAVLLVTGYRALV